jgi:carboxylesterase
MLTQHEKPWPRDPLTHVILGAEPFAFGSGDHAVLFIHGWTSTPRELRFIGEKVGQKGFAAHGTLLPGHGRTLRALQATSFSDYLRHCEEVFGDLMLKHDKVSIVGLSMGGLLGLHLAAQRKVHGLVLYAPFLRPSGSTMGISNRRMAGLAKLWTDEIIKDVEGPILDKTQLADHIAYHAMPAPGLADVVKAAEDIVPLLSRVTCPALLVHAVKDRTSDFEGSLQLMRSLGSEDRTLIALSRSNHVITLDHERDRVEQATLHWLENHR